MEFEKFLTLMNTLLGSNGCPWDKEQTHQSLRQYLLEESYEVIEAINQGNMQAVKEELGDVLLQIVFHAKIAEKAGNFAMDDVIKSISDKLISRHSHIFGTDTAKNAEEVALLWQKNKEKEQKGPYVIPKAMPALLRAEKVINRTKVTKQSKESLVMDIKHRLDEMCKSDNHIIINEEFGAILLQLVYLSNILEINAEFSLTNATEKYINTFSD